MTGPRNSRGRSRPPRRHESQDGADEQQRFLNWLDFQHDEAVRWARAVLAAPEQGLILDTETTGLDHKAEIVQIGIVAIDGSPLVDTLIRPAQAIPAVATGIHGITDEMVSGAPCFSDLRERLVSLLGSRTVIIYNAEFDLRLLDQTAARHGVPRIHVPRWACAMKWYAQYSGDWQPARGSRPAGFRWKPLSGGDHSAIGDCRATLALLRAMAATRLRDREAAEPPGHD